MEFPDELWESIMSYFHSIYKKPSHYVSIMNCPSFYRRRCINLYWSSNNSSLKQIVWNPTPGIFDSFYIWIVLDNWVFWEFDDINILQPKLTLNRKVASGKVLEDFKQIWQEYAQNGSRGNLISRIKY
uniref:F-box domain-containing protein n=1 Tax=Florenciella sp. virus SA2 TaxID=3240092 RepID=A0AB39J755_9VIRU